MTYDNIYILLVIAQKFEDFKLSFSRSNERQRQAVLNSLNSVKDAKNALEIGLTYDAITVSIEEAITSLLELTGERTSDEVVDRVFHNFCVGK